MSNNTHATHRPSFEWSDPFLLHNQLTDEEQMVQKIST